MSSLTHFTMCYLPGELVGVFFMHANPFRRLVFTAISAFVLDGIYGFVVGKNVPYMHIKCF